MVEYMSEANAILFFSARENNSSGSREPVYAITGQHGRVRPSTSCNSPSMCMWCSHYLRVSSEDQRRLEGNARRGRTFGRPVKKATALSEHTVPGPTAVSGHSRVVSRQRTGE